MIRPVKSEYSYIRPIFILVAAWVMATAQTIRKHTNSILRYDAFVMLPAYHIFYQIFIISSLFYIYQYDIHKDVENGTIEFDNYKDSVNENFGFILNESSVQVYLLILGVIFGISLLSGILAAYIIKNNVRGWRPKSLPEYRKIFSIYSAINLGLCIITFFVMTASISNQKA